MKLIYKIYRSFLRHNSFLRYQYPPPNPDFKIRLFCHNDRDKVRDLYKLNEFDRFPEGNLISFNKYLESSPQSFFVAELNGKEIVACGGVVAIGTHFHTICYLLVDPAFHNCGIGSNLAIALIAFATRDNEVNFSFVYAVDKSMEFWERFSYSSGAKWKATDGKYYPICAFAYSKELMKPVIKVLKKRGHLIDPNLPINYDEDVNPFIAVKIDNNKYEIELKQPIL